MGMERPAGIRAEVVTERSAASIVKDVHVWAEGIPPMNPEQIDVVAGCPLDGWDSARRTRLESFAARRVQSEAAEDRRHDREP